jgi:hypothetical protein
VNSAVGQNVCTDVEGNIYVTGFFAFTANFQCDTLTALGDEDIFLAKYDSAGNCIWAKRAGGNYTGSYSTDRGYAIAVDEDGNVYVTGSFVATADFDSIVLTSETMANDVFLAKYDNDGNVIWVKHAHGFSDEEGRAIVIDPNGDILIAGSYVPNVNFDGNILTGWGNYDAFVAKYDSDGNFLSFMNAGGPSWNEFIYDIALDKHGNIYTCGSFSDTAYFGNNTLHSISNYDAFIAKIGKLNVNSIDEQSNTASFSIYPNPIKSSATFEFTLSTNKRVGICIYNLLGNKVDEVINSDLNSGSYQIKYSPTTLASGIYLCKVTIDGAEETIKIAIIQ